MKKNNEIKRVLQRLAHCEEPLSFQTPATITADLKTYLDYYGFNINGIDFHFGKVEINKTKIVVQIFSPKQSHNTVFLLHGYLDHVGGLKNIIQYLINHNYRVISYDLQGHGLSAGRTASVDDFTDYVITLEKLMEKAKCELTGPFYVIGHSTGGAIIINYVLKKLDHHFDKIVLVAPLIRSSHWHLTKISFYLANPIPFIEHIKRSFRKNSSDKKYLAFTKVDPLQPKAIPLNWVNALLNWNKEIHIYSPSNADICVIQGTKDKTVEWKYNLAFLKNKFQRLQVFPIKNGRHALFNEKKQIREEVFHSIYSFLKSK